MFVTPKFFPNENAPYVADSFSKAVGVLIDSVSQKDSASHVPEISLEVPFRGRIDVDSMRKLVGLPFEISIQKKGKMSILCRGGFSGTEADDMDDYLASGHSKNKSLIGLGPIRNFLPSFLRRRVLQGTLPVSNSQRSLHADVKAHTHHVGVSYDIRGTEKNAGNSPSLNDLEVIAHSKTTNEFLFSKFGLTHIKYDGNAKTVLDFASDFRDFLLKSGKFNEEILDGVRKVSVEDFAESLVDNLENSVVFLNLYEEWVKSVCKLTKISWDDVTTEGENLMQIFLDKNF